MREVPTELVFPTGPSLPDSEGFNSYLRQYDVFIETTTQMLATPRLQERLLLALEAIANVFGYQQSAIAIINERDAALRVRAALGFDEEQANARVEMPLDSSAACVRVIHDARPLWIFIQDDPASSSLFNKMKWKNDVLALPLFGFPGISESGVHDSGGGRFVEHDWTFDPGSRLLHNRNASFPLLPNYNVNVSGLSRS